MSRTKRSEVRVQRGSISDSEEKVRKPAVNPVVAEVYLILHASMTLLSPLLKNTAPTLLSLNQRLYLAT